MSFVHFFDFGFFFNVESYDNRPSNGLPQAWLFCLSSCDYTSEFAIRRANTIGETISYWLRG